MRIVLARFIFSALAALAAAPAFSQVVNAPATGPIAINVVEGAAYNQNFSTLAEAGPSSALPAGWAFRESGSAAAVNGLYSAGSGSGTAGDVYSFGATGSTERAFGTLFSGTNTPWIGAKFVNGGANPTNTVSISYTGEQWRRGNAGQDRLVFEYSTDATATLDSGTWTPAPLLDFVSCTNTAPPTSGGTAPICTTPSISATLNVALAPGATLWIRWRDTDAAPGADDGLAVDDFSLTIGGEVTPTLSISDASVAEGNAGPTTLTFTASLTQAHSSDVTFAVQTGDGAGTAGATASSDYVAVAGQQGVIPAGQTSAQVQITVNGDAVVEEDETFTVMLSNVSAGVTAGDLQATGTILNDDTAPVTCNPTHTISEIQGTGLTAAFTGAQVVRGIVTARADQGFFLQEPVTSTASVASQGIFVFTSTAAPATAVVGAEVCVSGTVADFSGETQITSPVVTPLTAGNPLPAPIELTTANLNPDAGPNQLERYEGMLVFINDARTTAPTASFGESAVTLPAYFRPFREPGIDITSAGPQGNCLQTSDENPDQAGCIPRFDSNPENIVLDTDGLEGFGTRNLAAGSTFDLIAPLRFQFGNYRLLPGELPTDLPPRTPVSPVGADRLTVATFNLENFTGGARTALAVDNIKNYLLNPDVIGLQEIASEAALTELASALNAANAGATNYIPVFRQSPDDVRNNVFLYNANRVSQIAVTQYPADTFTFCGSTDTLNDRRPLAFRGQLNGAPGTAPYVFTVVNFHQRSLIGIDDPTPFNPAVCPGETVASRLWFKRARQAEFAAALLDQLQDLGQEVIALGDWNAFPFNDGYVDVMGTVIGDPAAPSEVYLATGDYNEPNFINLVNTLPLNQRYSYVFDFNAQVLDQIIVSADVFARNPLYEYARVDADYPESVRLSDHDPARVAIPVPTATQVTGVTIQRSAMVFDRRLNKWRATFVVRNTSGQVLNQPLSLVFTNIAPTATTVDNAAGTTDAFGTAAPYVALPAIQANQAVAVQVFFNAPAGTAPTFQERVYQGTF